MAASKRLNQLLRRLDMLEKHLLPKQFSLTGRYSREQNYKTRAYLLLAHAELEAYFEDRAKSRAEIANAQWKRAGVCSPVLSRLVVHHQKELEAISKNSVEKAVNFYLNNVENNHGILDKDLMSLLLPIGLSHADLDTRLVSACHQLGRKRGEFAHKSFKVNQQIDPKTKRDNVRKNILPELKELDRKIGSLR